jgi:hypothetical protein
LTYPTSWFEETIAKHTSIASVTAPENGHVRLERKEHPPIVVAPVAGTRVTAEDIVKILGRGPADIICLITKAGHYDWDARERAEQAGASVHTMKELMTSLSDADPRPFVNKNVAFARDALGQHTRVHEVRMICEASMQLVRDGLSTVEIAVEYEYEFGEEALVRALNHHPGVDAVLNSNPNGKPTTAALKHAEQAGVGLFSFRELMGALNFEGSAFRNYRRSN